MISNQEKDEFVAVRVQDPRMQNEGSWNSYVDYKIFLHTNSKAFTAKTSCVRRRYSEFSWLKKKLQKNTGLVPVPELPGKSFFFFSSEDFLEKRRKGLQAFLDNVVNMTVCLSDSQLHLFLQTQLPVGHIQDCVNGHTPYSVTDAILTYASSNRGYAQAQEEDAVKAPSLTVSYESMESPAPHQPKDLFSSELLFCGDPDPPGGSPEICEGDAVELQSEESSSVRIVQKDDRLQAEAIFFLGGSLDDLEGLGLAEPTQQSSCCRTRIQTPAEVHSPVGAGLLEEECWVREEGADETGPHPDSEEEEDQRESSGQAKPENVDSEPEEFANSAAMSYFMDRDFEERGTESDTRSQEEVLDVVCGEPPVLEEFKSPDGRSDESQSKAETALPAEIHQETLDVLGVPGDLVQQADRADLDAAEDGHSSSNESIAKVSDDESVSGDAEDSIPEASGWSPLEASSRTILDLYTNGHSVGKGDVSAPEDEDEEPRNATGKSLDALEDLTENSDFSILESSCTAAGEGPEEVEEEEEEEER
ncbi:sorting nexin-11 [Cyclopterus lumpus]|uniref:PX domain-containing protein n=1 Tax=Cyclopterus lumpus TaxID=8103 RepID=A0A8C3GCQ3_CYCLU|nr:sorting nexin-11 [Cyclopterus lumpus]XP_034414682.1 sorting nexin-11 [Cyclopterus lumpus]